MNASDTSRSFGEVDESQFKAGVGNMHGKVAYYRYRRTKTIKMPHNEGAQSRFHSDEGAPDARMLLTC